MPEPVLALDNIETCYGLKSGPVRSFVGDCTQ